MVVVADTSDFVVTHRGTTNRLPTDISLILVLFVPSTSQSWVVFDAHITRLSFHLLACHSSLYYAMLLLYAANVTSVRLCSDYASK